MLIAKRERFSREYVIDLNCTKAAIRAGYSKKTAYSIGESLLKNIEVKARVKELQAEIAERNKLSADEVIAELRALAFWSINDFIQQDNVIVDISQLDKNLTRPVVGIKIKETTTSIGEIVTKEVNTELKLSDKRAALVDLGRHLGVFEKDNKQLPNMTIIIGKRRLDAE